MEAQSVLDQPRGRRARRFLRHLLEMIVVMMLGMCVLGATWGAFHQIVFGSALAEASAITSGWPPSRWPST